MDERLLIRDMLLSPAATARLTPRQWDVLIRQARRANLLARLAVMLNSLQLLDQVPPAPRQHLLSALQLARRQAIAVRWEVSCIRKALAEVGAPVILLKGAAYLMSDVPGFEGRIFSDVDILVPRRALGEVESALMISGWRSQDVTAYDQRYYRQWMHEIPPMSHIRRGTTIDVHHTILPESARIKVNTPALFEGIRPLPDLTGMFVLSPVDMLLHSATHLFHEGQFENGLRDLFDLDSLLRHFGAMPGFWDGLVPRAQTLGLSRPSFYALRYTAMWLGTPVPTAVLMASRAAGAPPAWLLRLVDACFFKVLRPQHATSEDRGSPLARLLLYVRSHWMRMPMHLLSYHLLRKLVVRPKPPEPPKPAGEATEGAANQATNA